jgi:hypothetical protein
MSHDCHADPVAPQAIVLIIKFKHVTGGYVPVVCRALRGKGGDSVVLLRERAHDEDHHEPEHELLLGRQ